MKKPSYRIHNFTFFGTSLSELKHVVNEVFDHHIYYFETNSKNPRIIDVGAHLGVASHYFAHTHPFAKILAVEPHPVSFSLLQENCQWNQLENISLIQACVVPKSNTLSQNLSLSNNSLQKTTLFTDSAGEWLSSTSYRQGGWNGSQAEMIQIEVPAITLEQLINNQPVQLLKIDIEGAEWEVLLSAQDELRYVERLILEYHPHQDHPIEKLISHLQKFQLRPTQPVPVSPKKRKQLQILEFITKKLARKI
jgi:FkbM family methyltransferase